MRRSAGVLLNPSSFPGEFGIGDFSRNAETILSSFAKCGMSWWQVLPITTLGDGNSPYSGVSTYAGNYLYINPFSLENQGLVTREEVMAAKYYGEPYQVDYDFARRTRSKLLEQAFSRISDQTKQEIARFDEQNDWLDDYALFEALAEKFGYCWYEWENGLKMREPTALAAARESLSHRIDYYKYVQYQFNREWSRLKAFANQEGLSVLGDLPFYVSLESADVWANQRLFRLGNDGRPVEVAGVPPDYFAENGQMWGNPLYDFDEMRKDGYRWWRNRVSYCLKLYDGLRLDHFRAFAEYYAIPNDGTHDARDGKWLTGAGKELIGYFKSDNRDALFVAEDLGIIDEKVEELVEWSGFPSMKVMQFAFESFDSQHLPHKFKQNNVAYTGTHDNNTTLGWLYELREDVREYALDYCQGNTFGWGAGGPQCPSVRAIIRTLLASVADLAIVPIQDFAGYGSDTRMNIPGVAKDNWKFRTHLDMLMSIDTRYFSTLVNLYGRNIRN